MHVFFIFIFLVKFLCLRRGWLFMMFFYSVFFYLNRKSSGLAMYLNKYIKMHTPCTVEGNLSCIICSRYLNTYMLLYTVLKCTCTPVHKVHGTCTFTIPLLHAFIVAHFFFLQWPKWPSTFLAQLTVGNTESRMFSALRSLLISSYSEVHNATFVLVLLVLVVLL